MNIQEYLSHFKGVKVLGNGRYSVLCPAHPDNNQSLSITDNGNKILLYCHAGCEYHDILRAAGLEQETQSLWQRICEYIYTQTLRKVRWLKPDGKKTFTWESKKNPTDSLWQSGANGQTPPLYNQMELVLVNRNSTIYIVEGERDVDTLTAHGRVAICSPHGATKGNPHGKWLQAYTDRLHGFNVAIIMDNDEVGKIYARTVATCLQGVANSVKLIDLTCKWSDLQEHGDISDVFTANGNDPKIFDELDELTAMTPMATMTSMASMADVPLQSDVTSAEYKPYKGSEIVSAQDLQRAVLPPVKYLVEGLLAVGTSIMSAASKIGKSWLAMYLGLTVSTGEMFWDRQTEQCGVLYLALEDTYNRLQDRLNKVLNGRPAPEHFYFLTDVPNLDNGLLGVLDEYLQRYPDIRLIIVDTLQKIRGRGSSASSMYQQDYSDMGTLKRFAEERNLSFLYIHHNRKTDDKNDPYNMISGSVGIMGAADTIFVITNERRRHQLQRARVVLTARKHNNIQQCKTQRTAGTVGPQTTTRLCREAWAGFV